MCHYRSVRYWLKVHYIITLRFIYIIVLSTHKVYTLNCKGCIYIWKVYIYAITGLCVIG